MIGTTKTETSDLTCRMAMSTKQRIVLRIAALALIVQLVYVPTRTEYGGRMAELATRKYVDEYHLIWEGDDIRAGDLFIQMLVTITAAGLLFFSLKANRV